MLEAALWTAATALEEKADFSRRLSLRFRDGGQELSAQRYREQSENAVAQFALVRQALAELVAPPAAEEQRAS